MKPISNLLRQYGPYKAVEMLDGSADLALFHAMHTQSGRLVLLRVLAVLKQNAVKNHDAMTRCLEDLQQLIKIEHPSLTKMVDYGMDGKYLYIAYEGVHGVRLADKLYGGHTPTDEIRPIVRLPSLGETAELLRQVGSALQCVHDAGQVHGQIEPYSVFIEGATAFLADVGLLRLQKHVFQMDMTSSFNMTRYSAPEVWASERFTPATDQYALACLAYELVTGSAPFESPKILELMNAHLYNTVRPPHELRPERNLPAELGLIFWQALAKDPSERFPSVLDFVNAFSRIVYGREGSPTGLFATYS